jgi:aryl-alcohol dehydrogenase-like predicted oxidoreductase
VRYRTLGKTGFEISEIGYGSWGCGGDWWKDACDEDSLASMNVACDLGVNYIDTAANYGMGRAEKLVGQVARGRSDKIYVSTKVYPKNFNFVPSPGDSFSEAYPKGWLTECTENSLRNLGMECVDLQNFHVWVDDWAQVDEWKTEVEKLKEAGKIRAMGLSLVFPMETHHVPVAAIETGLIDACQVVFNIFEQEAATKLFPLTAEKNIGVVVRCPLDEGALTGKITPDCSWEEGDWRNDYFRGERKQQVCDRVNALDFLMKGDVETLPEAALRYILSFDAVSSVIPGMRNVKHAEANVCASDKGALPTADMEELKNHAWPHNFWF